MIFESTLIVATNTDVLAVGRLNAIPYLGTLELILLADLGDASNFYALTIQLPNGDVPVDGQRVFAGSAGTDMTVDQREVMKFKFRATAGGHFVVSLTETGTAVCAFIAILTP